MKKLFTYLLLLSAGCLFLSYVTAGMITEEQKQRISEVTHVHLWGVKSKPAVLVLQGSKPLRPAQEIQVQLGSQNLEVHSSTDNQIHYEYFGDKQKPIQVIEEGSRIIFKSQDDWFIGWYFSDEVSEKLVIAVPTSLQQLKITIGSGDSRFETVVVDQLFVQMGSGNIWMTDSQFKNFDFKIGSGDLQAHRNSMGQGVIKMGSGDWLFDQDKITSVDLSAGSGDGSGKIQESQNVKIQSGSGDIHLELQKSNECRVSLGSGDIKMKTDSQQLQIKSGSGDQSLQLENKTPQAELISASGDIKIEMKEDVDLKGEVKTNSGEFGGLAFHVPASDHHQQEFVLGQGKGQLKISTSSGDVELQVLRE